MTDAKKPLGWAERYRIVLPRDSMDKLLSWIKAGRGVNIWCNHDLSGGPKYSRCGHLIFTPGDHIDRPHWAYYIVEKLEDLTRADLFLDESRDTKPSAKERPYWKYDKRARQWYRETPYTPTDEEIKP